MTDPYILSGTALGISALIFMMLDQIGSPTRPAERFRRGLQAALDTFALVTALKLPTYTVWRDDVDFSPDERILIMGAGFYLVSSLLSI